MKEIGFEQFEQAGGNPMAGVAGDDQKFFRLGEETLGVLAMYEEDEVTRFSASVLRPSKYFDGQFRIDGSEFDSGKTEKSIERAKESVTEWLENQQE